MGEFIFYDEDEDFELDDDFEFVDDEDNDFETDEKETEIEDDEDFNKYERVNDGLQPFGYMYIGGFIAMALSNLF